MNWLLWVYVGVTVVLWPVMLGVSLSDQWEKKKADNLDFMVLACQWMFIAAIWPLLVPTLFCWLLTDYYKAKRKAGNAE